MEGGGLFGGQHHDILNLDMDVVHEMNLDNVDQEIMNSLMSEEIVPHSFEEEIHQLQQDDLSELKHHPELPGTSGIEATDVGSLLEQFEEASQTAGDCDSLKPSLPVHFDWNEKCGVDVITTEDRSGLASKKKKLTDEVLQKLKAANKPKSATVMLPIGVPSKRGRGRTMARGRAVALPASCTPLKLQRIMMQNTELKDCLDFENSSEEALGITNKSSRTPSKTRDESTENGQFELSENYYESISDHDYCKNAGVSFGVGPCEDSQNGGINDNSLKENFEDGEIVGTEDQGTTNSKSGANSTHFSDQKQAWAKRNYRKREESPEVESNEKYFDKLPSYYTALSIPSKSMKRNVSSLSLHSEKSGISVHDYITRDPSPNRGDTVYDKLPAYYSCFTNSTKYDQYPGDSVNSQYSNDSRVTSSGYSSRSQSPSLVIDSRRTSRSRSRSWSGSRSRSSSCSRSRSNSRSVSQRSQRRKRGASYSSYSSCSSSRSRSRSYSSSRSRSYSRSSHSSSSSRSRSRSRSQSQSKRAWKRESRLRGERFERRNRSRSYSRYRSRSRSRSYSPPRYSRRSRDRYRNRSFSRSRSRSIEMRRQRNKERREEEMKLQIKERRIIYVGRLPEDYTRRQLRKRFGRFGEIEHVTLHFREHGDNYGFVTFAYTCDAYAAIEKGNNIPGEPKFDLCFGGRRQFCETEYADLDGIVEMEEEYQWAQGAKAENLNFDDLLKQARKKITAK